MIKAFFMLLAIVGANLMLVSGHGRWVCPAPRDANGEDGKHIKSDNTGNKMFPVVQTLCWLSEVMTLEPGDVILCGTSLGVMPMKPGCVVEVEIDGIGVLKNANGLATMNTQALIISCNDLRFGGRLAGVQQKHLKCLPA